MGETKSFMMKGLLSSMSVLDQNYQAGVVRAEWTLYRKISCILLLRSKAFTFCLFWSVKQEGAEKSKVMCS